MKTIKNILKFDVISTETVLGGLVTLAALFSLYAFTIGWSQPIVDLHAFRQTQTALSVLWMLKEGHYFTYQTPVLGYPWSIPMEFPLYQWLVVVTYKITHLHLDQCGRLVSISCFYLTLWPVYVLFKKLNFKTVAFKIFSCLFLLSPFYLFWARTFMIESLGLLLAIAFLAAAQSYLLRPKLLTAIIGIVFGCFCALTKITTFVPAIFFYLGLCTIDWYRKYGYIINIKIIRHYEAGALFILIPMLVGLLWVGYTDWIKTSHPIAHFLTSQALMTWNFGTLSQRISAYLWQLVILKQSLLTESLGYLVPFVILAIYGYIRKKYPHKIEDKMAIRLALFCSAIFLGTFLIFTNLYVEHNYYRYANTIYLIFSAAIILYIIFKKIPPVFFILMLFAIMVVQTITYRATYMRPAMWGAQYDRNYPVAQFVRKHTKPNDFVLIHGIDWSSIIAYYSERKSLTKNFVNFKDWAEKLQNIDKYSSGLPLGAMVFCNPGQRFIIDQKEKDLFIKLTKKYHRARVANCIVLYK